MTPTGKIITAPLSAVGHIDAREKWIITRVNPDIAGCIWRPALAPSQMLFGKYWEEVKGKSAEKYFYNFADLYREELKTQEKLRWMRRLWVLVCQGHTIVLACYCKSPERCHRKILGDFLREYGVEVQEYVPRQIELFGEGPA